MTISQPVVISRFQLIPRVARSRREFNTRLVTSPRDRCEVLRSVCISVCLSVCLSACISQQSHAQTSRNFLYILPVAVARSSSDNNAISYVLPVLWMTSCFHIMGQAWSLRRSELFTVTRQVAPLNCAPGAKSAIFDCLVVYVESYNLYESYELCPHKLSLPVESLKNIVLKT